MNEMPPDPSSKNNDFKIVLGAIACIALGAGACYWITRTQPKRVASLTPTTVTSASVAAGDVDNIPLSFSTLSSYYYELPQVPDEPGAKVAAPRDPIPAPVKAFNGKKVAVQGYMVPMKFTNGKTSEFLLVRDQSICCNFGRPPRMNEWINVRMKGNAEAHVIMDQPVTVYGKIDIGELVDRGDVQSLYRIEADDVAGPLDL